ncbi:PTS glucose transporter subunit IIA, partial [Streptococcus suis]
YSEAASNITNAMIAAAISIIVTFILAYFLGIDEETSTVNLEKVAPGISSRKNVFSPLSGQILPLEKVNDATFSKKMLGEGVAIIPKDGKVYAPFDGAVTSLFP